MTAYDRHIGHRRHFQPRELADVLRAAGFDVLRATGAGFPFFNLYRLLMRALGNRLIDVAGSGEPSAVARAAMGAFAALLRSNTRLSRRRLADRRRGAGSALRAGGGACVVPPFGSVRAQLRRAPLASRLRARPGRPRRSDRHRRLPDLCELQRQPLLLGVRLHRRSLPSSHVRDLPRPDACVRAFGGAAWADSASARARRGHASSHRLESSAGRPRTEPSRGRRARPRGCDRLRGAGQQGVVRPDRAWLLRDGRPGRLGSVTTEATRPVRGRELAEHCRRPSDPWAALCGLGVDAGDSDRDRRGPPLPMASTLAGHRVDGWCRRMARPRIPTGSGPHPIEATSSGERSCS